KPLLGDLHYRLDRLTAHANISEDRRGRQVVIPKIVVDELKMPDAFTGVGPDAHETVAEEIVSKPVPAIHVACRRGQREIDVSEFFICAEVRPGIDGTGVLPRPVFPTFDTELAILWNYFKCPPDFARLHVVCANVATSSFLNVRVVCDRR